MALWQVVAAPIELFPHPDPKVDRMLLGKVGPFQVVVAKANNYQNGDVIVFAPERSVLPEDLRPHYCNADTGESYLSGPNKDRVKAIRLRGELSEGVTIPLAYVTEKLGEIPLNEDLSERLGISKYEPPIPSQLAGKVSNVDEMRPNFYRHDVEQFRIYQDQMIEGENVIITEKIHGSQINIYKTPGTGTVYITSKGLAGADRTILENEGNGYWKAAKNSGVLDRISSTWGSGVSVQVFGEVIPIQKGYSYGQVEPTLRVFRVQINGEFLDHMDMNEENADGFWKNIWVPEVYRGPLNMESAVKLANRKEGVSGQQLHIAEGVVIAPHPIRLARQGFPLLLKVINPKYQGSDEDIS